MNPTDPQSQTATNAQGSGKQYNIPAAVQEKYPELIELIKVTQSMTEDEREYWFQILPIMNEEQVARLRKILDDEKAQLKKIDEEYQSELSKINKKHVDEWQEIEKKETAKREGREQLKAAEASHEDEEAAAEAALLKDLENL